MNLETERLVLRDWCEQDKAPLADILGNQQVRRYYPNILNHAETADLIDRFIASRLKHGFCFMAAESKRDQRLIGLIGIAHIPDKLRRAIAGNPAIEIGWQLDDAVWGQGLAPEGALACLDYAWQELRVPEVASFTFKGNLPSQRVMEKIGMARDISGDFDHPAQPLSNPLRQHVLYRLKNPLL